MAMFAVATIPLIKPPRNVDVHQVWYAEDATSGGSLENVRKWWEELNHLGPGFGYSSNPVKTVLLTKQEFLPKAKEIFTGTGVSITTY